jgi:hypothetical protein
VIPGQRYNYVGAPKLSTLFPKGISNKIPIKNEWHGYKNNRGVRVKDHFIRKVFMVFLRMVVVDCIENNVKFITPMKDWFAIHICAKSDKASISRIKRKETYKNVDPIATEFKIYEVSIDNPHCKRRFWPVRISHGMYKRIVERANQGVKYWQRETY